ncbi:transposase [Armatimonas sp.]|uniref:transposase n=1 Tax=Armatimonas sp. TaxID=1872638 RepID=UPI00286CE3B5|nr:transposase [Armatimonas sp.]
MPDILSLLLNLQPVLTKTTCRQLYQIVMAMLVMPAHITQRGIARWADKGGSYRTVHRFFHTNIDWMQVNWLQFLMRLYVATDTYLLVGDETVVKKAGKHTFGLDRFFSSLADRPVAGVAFFALALVSVQKRQAYTLSVQQVVRTQDEKDRARQKREDRKTKNRKTGGTVKKAGRPKGSKNKNKEQITLSPELGRILLWTQKLLTLIGKKIALHYFVLDGHFGNHPSYQMTRQLGLHLISKMRHDAQLYLLPTEAQKQACPRLQYGQRLDYDNLPAASRVSCQKEEGYEREVYQIQCRHKDFAEVLNIVVIVKTHLVSGRRGHVLLFSSDLALEALTLIDYYGLRFQIEFEFRDAKQHFGLSDFVCVGETSVHNAVGLSFFLGNLSCHLLERFGESFPEAGVVDLKSYYRGRRYALETLKCLPSALKCLPEFADGIVCSGVLSRLESVVDQVCRLGLIHPGGKVASGGAPTATMELCT